MQLDPLSYIARAANAATPASTPGSASSSAASGSSAPTVSVTDFMQLLSTEMSNQDPLQPMDPTQTMTQLAQFTTLQEATAQAQSQSLATGNSFLGAQVTVSNGSGLAPTTGTVTGIDASNVASGGVPQLVISGATQEYPLSSVTLVQYPTPASTTSSGAATNPTSTSTPAPTTGTGQ